MKKNAQKILLSLYSPRVESSFRASTNKIKLLIPSLTPGGRRSLIHVLKNNGLINSERVLGKTSVGITQHGIHAIESKFPALSSKWNTWQGSWDCVVFVKAPKSDNQFRYLRSLLINEGSISISRGVYISPLSFSEKVVHECSETYKDSILMFSIGEWKVASLRSLIVNKYGLLDFIESYSGVSNDVSKLLASSDANNRLISMNKVDINLVYDRLRDILEEDPGFCHYYFNEVPRAVEILADLNSLFLQY